MKSVEYINFLELVNSFKSENKKDLPALTLADSGESFSYGEFYKRIKNFFSQLKNLEKSDRVILQNINSLDWACLYFAIILRGAVVVPLDTRVSEDFKNEVIKSLEPKIIIDGRFAVENLSQEITEEDLSNFSDTGELAQVVFTSGTWSIPKGVMLSQENILTNAYQVLDIYGHDLEHTSLSILPLSHTYQQTVGFILPLIVGSHIVFLDKIDSFKLIESIKKYDIQTMLVAPKVLQLIKNSILRKIKNPKHRIIFEKFVCKSVYLPKIIRKFIFSPVRKQIGITLSNLIVGGAMLTKDLDLFFQGLGYNVPVGYGLSETSPVISVSLGNRNVEGNVGRIVKGLDYKINELGELEVKGKNLFLGYWPERRVEEYFNTRDIVNLHKKNILIKGRTKDLIIYPNGDKIFTEDLEQIIKKHSGFEEACIVHRSLDGNINVYCAVKHSGNVDVEKILNDLHTKIPQVVKIHSLKVFSDDFPYTHTLKPNKKKILEIFTN